MISANGDKSKIDWDGPLRIHIISEAKKSSVRDIIFFFVISEIKSAPLKEIQTESWQPKVQHFTSQCYPTAMHHFCLL